MRFLRRPKLNPDEVADRWQPRLYARLIALILLAAYAIVFVIENSQQVRIHFVFATARVSLIGMTLVALAVGLLAGILLAQLERRRRRRSHERAEPGDAV